MSYHDMSPLAGTPTRTIADMVALAKQFIEQPGSSWEERQIGNDVLTLRDEINLKEALLGQTVVKEALDNAHAGLPSPKQLATMCNEQEAQLTDYAIRLEVAEALADAPGGENGG